MEYLYSLDVNVHPFHDSTGAVSPWHIAPHADGASYMRCHTVKITDEPYYRTGYYKTIVSEHHDDADSELLKISSLVLPEATWLRVYAEAAGMAALNQPESLQVLASRASGMPIPKGY